MVAPSGSATVGFQMNLVPSTVTYQFAVNFWGSSPYSATAWRWAASSDSWRPSTRRCAKAMEWPIHVPSTRISTETMTTSVEVADRVTVDEAEAAYLEQARAAGVQCH